MKSKRVLSGLPYKCGKYIYVIKCGKYYKIGITRRIGARITDYRVHNPYDIKLLIYADRENHKELEKALHKRFEKFLHKGEWFILNKNQVKEIIKLINNEGI